MSLTGRVVIGSWSYPRIFFHTGNSLMVEISRSGCWPCSLCERRVSEIEDRLQEAFVRYKWTSSGAARYVDIELPAGEKVEVGNYLSRVLGVPVRETA